MRSKDEDSRLAGGSNTSAFDLFLTDLVLGEQTLTVRWEFDHDAASSASTQAWALCAPA
jgi:hypothetical protein